MLLPASLYVIANRGKIWHRDRGQNAFNLKEMAKRSTPKKDANSKAADLEKDTTDGMGQKLTTAQGLPINDNQNSLKGGQRGPTLGEDHILRDKITHFDHERIPERVVHARGSGAHGHFQVYEPLAKWTKAGFLNDPGRRTPVFARISTVAGFRGSTDLPRDVRGFAVKFYTEEGIYDLVGNNMPVFFIQDAIKFPDLVHSVKPEAHTEMPQASSAHETFWDFISLMPESMHTIMWLMSDRGIPRSLRMMEGFGVHTFRFVNEQGKSSFVKFHWKPLLGVHSVAWDEATKISGKDPDFHRRDLWEAIENGDFPEWELGVQIVEAKDEHKFSFDLLDPTKLIPEELVPVQRVGKMTLNRNPDNFFAETEQVAFHPGHLVPGIDLSNDPLLQGRLFSYTDTQLTRLGGPNFNELPINRSLAPVHNNQRDGFMRHTIAKQHINYEPNTLGGGCPYQAGLKDGGFTSFPEPMEDMKVRAKSEKFMDHFSQAKLFYHSQSKPEQNHLINAPACAVHRQRSRDSRRHARLRRYAARQRRGGCLWHRSSRGGISAEPQYPCGYATRRRSALRRGTDDQAFQGPEHGRYDQGHHPHQTSGHIGRCQGCKPSECVEVRSRSQGRHGKSDRPGEACRCGPHLDDHHLRGLRCDRCGRSGAVG